jgi:hypothetical protein
MSALWNVCAKLAMPKGATTRSGLPLPFAAATS